MKAELLICSMSITEGIFESSIDLSPGWFGVTLLSLSEASLCGLLKKQSGLFIQLWRKWGSTRKREQSKTLSTLRFDTEQTFCPSIPFQVHHLWWLLFCCLCSRLLSSHLLETILALPLDCLLLSYFISHTFSSGPLHLSSNTEHQRNPQRLSGAKIQRRRSPYFPGDEADMSCRPRMQHESVQLQTGSKSIDSLIPCRPLKLWADANHDISAYF